MLEGLRGALDVRGRWIQVECSLVLGAVGASSELAARGDVVSDETMDLCHLVRPKASGECFMELIMEATCPCRVWCFRSVATPGVEWPCAHDRGLVSVRRISKGLRFSFVRA